MKKWITGFCVILLGVGLVTAFRARAESVAADEEMLRLLPRETQGLAFADIAALRASPLGTEFLGKVPAPRHFDEFARATGFVVSRDLERVMIGKLEGDDLLAVARAQYDRVKVEQYVREKQLDSETYLGWTIYYLKDADFGVSFLDKYVLLGKKEPLKQAIDRVAAPAPSALDNTQLREEIGSIQAGSQVWATGDVPSGLLSNRLPVPRGAHPGVEFLKSLRHGSYEMRVDTDVHIRATGDFTDPQTAQNTSDLLRGLVAAAKFQVSRNPDLILLLDGFSIQASGPSVRITFDADGELLKKLRSFKRAALE